MRYTVHYSTPLYCTVSIVYYCTVYYKLVCGIFYRYSQITTSSVKYILCALAGSLWQRKTLVGNGGLLFNFSKKSNLQRHMFTYILWQKREELKVCSADDGR